jgi:hypothetical protein
MSRRIQSLEWRLLAKHLGNVSKDQVGRVMRKHDLHLERRQSWCVSTDPSSIARLPRFTTRSAGTCTKN